MSGKSIFSKIIALVAGILGFGIIASVIIPILNYEGILSPQYSKLISPIVENSRTLLTEASPQDFTRASNWFTDSDSSTFSLSNVSYYSINIPKLKIKNATVAIGGEDLSKYLVQYPGTALPGKKGNTVIFGHSVLPIFFNPKDYISIFSTIPTLKVGDDIVIDYDGITYYYRVESFFEVNPTDIEILEQDSTDSFVSLVTCVPPGDPRKPRRLIVRSRLVPPEM